MVQIGKYIIVAGVILIVVGVLITFLGNKFHWFGNLPGDVKIERENFKFFFPITTMILLSILLSLAMWIIRRFF
jgi:H+/Cl- antiporter ClcA